MTSHKLTENQREALVVWLCEGLRDAEIIERLQTGFGVTVTQQNVNHYRDKYAAQIAAAEEAAYKRLIQVGLCKRGERVPGRCVCMTRRMGHVRTWLVRALGVSARDCVRFTKIAACN